MKKLILIILLLLSGCTGIPENVKPIENFKLQDYLGQWYEIARLDHSFERGLSQVTAHYSMREDGGVKVINRGYLEQENKWKEKEGKAYFVDGENKGYLKVSFFGPFYGSYVIIDLDQEHYQYAVVCGPDKSYLWILSRKPQMDKTLLDKLIAKVSESGFAADKLIFVKQP